MLTDDPQWYVQKGARVQGPYTAAEVGHFLLLGRVRNSDRVSRDGELWEPVTQVPELIPDELLNLNTQDGWDNFMTARQNADQRHPEQQQGESISGEQRRQTDAARKNWLRLSGTRRSLDAGLDIDLAETSTPFAAYDVLPPPETLRQADWVRDDWMRNDWNRAANANSSALPWSLLGVTLVVLGVVVYINSMGVTPS